MMRTIKFFILVSVYLIASSCITQFIPETNENQELLVVEGLITDQPGTNTVILSKSLPLGLKSEAKPLSGCSVYISDDLGNSFRLNENLSGQYITDPSEFQGKVGRKYTLKIFTNNPAFGNYSYQSVPMEMKPVPPIDNVYYEKKLIKESYGSYPKQEGCQIYLDTHDSDSKCKFYRWDYTETWEFMLPFSYPVNNRCFIEQKSKSINVKSTTVLAEDIINRYPLIYISNESDRLKEKYSILVNQYSLTQDEFDYWEKLENFTEEVGGLYDITPASIPSNITCIENPAVKALGYFSVSAKSEKRIMIDEYFSGIVNLYKDCISDTVFNGAPISNLNIFVWILEDRAGPSYNPPYQVITSTRGCADCTVRGTKTEPPYWNGLK
jgi:hypothetical protein